MTQTTDEKAKVYEILDGFSTAMFVTLGENGRAEARPMHVAKVEKDDGKVWCFTGIGGRLANELVSEPEVLLTFQDGESAFLSLRGRGRVSRDKAQIKALWKEPYKVWFPGGPDDPEIALIAVDLIAAEYWDSRGANKLQYLFEAAKAYVKGTKPDVDHPDQHAKTSM